MIRTHSGDRVLLPSRNGLVAVNEILIVVAILSAMFWLVSQFMETVTDEPRATKAKTDAASERCVYRIALDDDHEQLWIYRPRDGLVQLNLATSEFDQSMPLPMGLSAVAHSCDGHTTIMCGFDGTLVLNRRGETPAIVHYDNAMDMVVDAAVSHCGETAVCSTMRGQVRGWTRHCHELHEFSYRLPAGANVARVGLNKAGDRMFVGRYDGTVLFLDPVTGVADSAVLRIDPQSNAECFAYAWSDDERLLASVCGNGRIRVYSVSNRNLVLDTALKSDSTNGRPTAIQISQDARRLAITTNGAPVIQVWNMETGRLDGELKGHKGIVRTMQFADADRLYSGSYDGTVREWSLETWSQSRIVD